MKSEAEWRLEVVLLTETLWRLIELGEELGYADSEATLKKVIKHLDSGYIHPEFKGTDEHSS